MEEPNKYFNEPDIDRPFEDNSLQDLMEEEEEIEREELPVQTIDDKQLFYCKNCNSYRLEILWYDLIQKKIQVRCLTCGIFFFLDPDFEFKNLNQKNKNKRRKKKRISSYLG